MTIWSRKGVLLHLVRLLVLCFTTLAGSQNLSTQAMAQTEGALPVHSSGKSEKGKLTGANAQVLTQSECHKVRAWMPGGEIYYDRQTRHIWAMVKVKDAVSKSGQRTGKYNLIKVNIDTSKVKRILSVKLRNKGFLIPHGRPLTGISIMSFKNVDDGCRSGTGAVTSVRVSGTSKARRVFSLEEYKITATNRGPGITDVASSSIKDLDPVTLQARFEMIFPKGQQPLFYSYKNKDLFTLKDSYPGTVYKYLGGSRKPSSIMKLKGGYKVLQDREKFGVVQIDRKSSSFLIREIKKWTGDSNKKYRVSAPDGLDPDLFSIQVRFDSLLAMAMGGTPQVRRQWDRAWLIHYGKNKIVSQMKPSPGEYISEGFLGKGSRYAFLLIKDKYTDNFRRLKLYDIAKNNWSDLLASVK